MGTPVQLPSNYRRIADSFDGLDPARKEAVIGQLQSQPDVDSLNRTVDQLCKNGGPEGELVGRIFQRNVENSAGDKSPGNLRTVDNKKLSPVQTKQPVQQGTGAMNVTPSEEPHTSTANPPKSGHPGTPGVAGNPPLDNDQR